MKRNFKKICFNYFLLVCIRFYYRQRLSLNKSCNLHIGTILFLRPNVSQGHSATFRQFKRRKYSMKRKIFIKTLKYAMNHNKSLIHQYTNRTYVLKRKEFIKYISYH